MISWGWKVWSPAVKLNNKYDGLLLSKVPISSFCFYILQADIYLMSNVKANTEKPKRNKSALPLTKLSHGGIKSL